MSKHRIFVFFSASLLLIVGTSAHAASIWLSPVTQTATIGEQLTLQLNMDFSTDPTLGGGLDIFYDNTMLEFVSFTYDPAFGDDPAVRRLPDISSDRLNGLTFGKDTGLAGPSVVGLLTFNAITLGMTSLSLADNVSPAGGFFSAVTFNPQTVSYQGAEVTIAAVPVPAALWLLLSGVALLATRTRKARIH